MVHVLVTGANRGLGLGIVRELLKNETVTNVYATHRHWADTKELCSIEDARVHVLEMELLEHITIGSVYLKIRDTVCQDGLNIIINNAGVYEPYDVDATVKRKVIVDQIEVNCVGPTIMCQGFLPQLRKAVKGGRKAIIVNVSDERASLNNIHTDNDPRALIYQMSKAALNMMTRSMGMDAKKDGVTIVAMAPGSVKTQLGGRQGMRTVEEAAGEMVHSILHKVNLSHAGGFYNTHMIPIPF